METQWPCSTMLANKQNQTSGNEPWNFCLVHCSEHSVYVLQMLLFCEYNCENALTNKCDRKSCLAYFKYVTSTYSSPSLNVSTPQCLFLYIFWGIYSIGDIWNLYMSYISHASTILYVSPRETLWPLFWNWRGGLGFLIFLIIAPLYCMLEWKLSIWLFCR